MSLKLGFWPYPQKRKRKLNFHLFHGQSVYEIQMKKILLPSAYFIDINREKLVLPSLLLMTYLTDYIVMFLLSRPVHVSRQKRDVRPHNKPLYLKEEAVVAVGKYFFGFSDNIGSKAIEFIISYDL